MVSLVDLPTDVMLKILKNLSFSDHMAVILVHSSIHRCYVDSNALKYHVACQISGVNDNVHNSLPISERLSQLEMHEKGWMFSQESFRREIAVPFKSSEICCISSGIFLLGDDDQPMLHYCTLPSSEEDNVSWSDIDLDPRATVLDVALAIEYDLIAIVQVIRVPDPTASDSHPVSVLLWELSSGRPHPRALNCQLGIQNIADIDEFYANIEICGPTIAVVTRNRFCVFDWSTAAANPDTLCLQPNTYTSIDFLSPTLIFLPNLHEDGLYPTLDIYKTHKSSSIKPTLVLVLGLPPMSYGFWAVSISCYSYPNPSEHGFSRSDRPFHASADDAIVTLNIQINDDEGDSNYFCLLVHRSSLIRLSQDAEVYLETPPITPWASWGPRLTRMFDTEQTTNQRWAATTAGQRAVIGVSSDEWIDVPYSDLTIFDFNPFSVKRVLKETGKKNTGKDLHDIDFPYAWLKATTLGSFVFDTKVKGFLPFVSFARNGSILEEAPLKFNGIIMDEERLIGLTTVDDGEHIAKLDVIYMRAEPYFLPDFLPDWIENESETDRQTWIGSIFHREDEDWGAATLYED